MKISRTIIMCKGGNTDLELKNKKVQIQARLGPGEKLPFNSTYSHQEYYNYNSKT